MAITIKQTRPISDAELLELSRRNPGYQIERQRDGGLTVTPTGSKSGYRSGELFRQLAQWSREGGAGPAFDSNTGFRLPDGSVLSPDASWLRRERWEALSDEEQEMFAPLCPDAVFEVRSQSDSIEELHAKMRAYLQNGAQIAVLIEPYERFVDLWRSGGEPERIVAGQIAFDPHLPGFVLQLDSIYG